MSQPSWIGQTLGGRYTIDALLGQGGMSAVYRGTDPNLRRTVAIKLIHGHLTSDPDFVRRFEAEAAAVAQLRHPNLIQVYDFNIDHGTYYMVLEFVPGETLHARLARLAAAHQALPVEDLLSIGIDVAEAMEYAHQRGLIHRDIKPANIMLNPQGQAVLMDFGIAKILGGAVHTTAGTVMGTAQYVSPEQVRGQRPTARSDVYSLGVTLFQMATGRPPFDGDSAMTVMLKHVNDPVPDLTQLNPGLPADLVAIIQRALAKDPERRLPSGAELASALRSVQARIRGATATRMEAGPVRPSASATRLDNAPPPSATVPPPVFAPLPSPPPAAAPAAAPRAARSKAPMWLLVGLPLVALVCLGAVVVSTLVLLNRNGKATQAAETAAPIAQASTATVASAPTGTPTEPTEAPPTREPTATPAFDAAGAGLVAIPAARFAMGSVDGPPDEQPAHEVLLDPYYIDQFEVTNARYQACVQAGACQPPASARSFTRASYFGSPDFADYPVVSVTWDQAAAFCAWDGGKRLPTEAEWEYAARGDDGRRFPWGNDFDRSRLPAGEGDTTRVGAFSAGASPFGVHDMAGNVLEWTADYYEPQYYIESVKENPPGPAFGDERALRGGSFGNPDSQSYTTTRRYHLAPTDADVDVGFRCARDAP